VTPPTMAASTRNGMIHERADDAWVSTAFSTLGWICAPQQARPRVNEV
jgi:hypothetical protein